MITLATLAEATQKEVFEQVKTHLLTQKKKSMVDDVCAYRGKGKLKCAAGCLIGEHEYQKNFENKRWNHLSDMNMVPSEHAVLIDSLQIVHDHYFVFQWEEELEKVRVNFNIE